MDKNPELHKHKPRKRNATRKYNVSMIETVMEGKKHYLWTHRHTKG